MMDIIFTPGKECPPFEYFCFGCGQCRLSFVEIANCSNCGTRITHRGEPNELDLPVLRKEYSYRERAE